MDEGPRSIPGDKILCEGRFQRYVVACMRNCPYGNDKCREFWAFFRSRGVSPQQYLRQHGIEEDLMKRIVFDCDRCGKRDIGEPYTLFRTSGEQEGERIPSEEFAPVFAKAGPQACSMGFVETILDALKAEHAFEHYCDACFKKIAGLASQIVGKPLPKVPATASKQSTVARALTTDRPAPVVKAPPPPEPTPAPRPSANRGDRDFASRAPAGLEETDFVKCTLRLAAKNIQYTNHLILL